MGFTPAKVPADFAADPDRTQIVHLFGVPQGPMLAKLHHSPTVQIRIRTSIKSYLYGISAPDKVHLCYEAQSLM